MDYKEHYARLLKNAKARITDEYVENHHIVPRCMGGTDDPDNLVNLTPEEHYVAHQLLVKIYPGNASLASAAMMMCANRKSNKVYGWLRRKHAEAMSIHQQGENNSQFGTVWINKQGSAIKIKQSEIPQYLNMGWSLGRKQKIAKVKKIIPRGIESEKYKWIVEQEIDILKEFDEHKSVNKILQDRGFKNREGNQILSEWLKSKGKSVLRRRNTAGVA